MEEGRRGGDGREHALWGMEGASTRAVETAVKEQGRS